MMSMYNIRMYNAMNAEKDVSNLHL